MPKNILITGRPGVGKTTLLKRLAERCGQWAVTGFYTEEIRENGVRVGFRAVTLSGHRAVFAHRDFHVHPDHRVGKYGVKPEVLEGLVLPHLDPCRKGADLVVIDEIAKMELFSDALRESFVRVLDDPTSVLATITLKGTGLIKRVKQREDVTLFTLTEKNRNALPEQIYRKLCEAVASSLSGSDPSRFEKFIRSFDSGQYWEAHEVLEEVWKVDRQDFYKGLIQVAASWVHLEHNNRSGVLKVLPRALRYLEKYPGRHRGWDLGRLISDCRDCLQSVGRQEHRSVSPSGVCSIRLADYYQSAR